jgi:hypothetical protein
MVRGGPTIFWSDPDILCALGGNRTPNNCSEDSCDILFTTRAHKMSGLSTELRAQCALGEPATNACIIVSPARFELAT